MAWKCYIGPRELSSKHIVHPKYDIYNPNKQTHTTSSSSCHLHVFRRWENTSQRSVLLFFCGRRSHSSAGLRSQQRRGRVPGTYPVHHEAFPSQRRQRCRQPRHQRAKALQRRCQPSAFTKRLRQGAPRHCRARQLPDRVTRAHIHSSVQQEHTYTDGNCHTDATDVLMKLILSGFVCSWNHLIFFCFCFLESSFSWGGKMIA